MVLRLIAAVEIAYGGSDRLFLHHTHRRECTYMVPRKLDHMTCSLIALYGELVDDQSRLGDPGVQVVGPVKVEDLSRPLTIVGNEALHLGSMKGRKRRGGQHEHS